MPESTVPSVGERIRELRSDDSRSMTMSQVQLAAAAEVSVDVVKRLEQGRYTPSIPTLHKIATALDVDIADLFRRVRPPLGAVGPQSGAVALRRAVVSVDDLLGEDPEVEPLDVERARATVGYAWAAYWRARTADVLPAILPEGLARVRATLREVSADERAAAHDLAAQMYQIASCTLTFLGHNDAAHHALREAIRTAEHGDDPLRPVALRGSIAWVLMRQGRYGEAHQVATVAAALVGATGDSPLPAWTLYGHLLVTGAIAAAGDRARPKAQVLLDEAREAATRTGHRNDYECEFSPEKVQMHAVSVAVATEDYDRALTEASRMPARSELTLRCRVNHLSNVALAHTRLGHDEAAIEVLMQIKQAAPQWLGVRHKAQMVIRELYDRATPAPLIELARTAGLLH